MAPSVGFPGRLGTAGRAVASAANIRRFGGGRVAFSSGAAGWLGTADQFRS